MLVGCKKVYIYGVQARLGAPSCREEEGVDVVEIFGDVHEDGAEKGQTNDPEVCAGEELARVSMEETMEAAYNER